MCMNGGSRKKQWGLLVLRFVVGIVFIYHGWMKLTGIDGATGMMQGIGLPMPMFWAWLVALVEFVGGIAVILGVFNRVVAALLAINMVVALLTVHVKMPYGSATEFPIVLLGALISLHLIGPGKCALMGRKNEECRCAEGCEPGEKSYDTGADDGCCGGGCGCGDSQGHEEHKKEKV